MAKTPKPYQLKQMPDSSGFRQCTLDLVCYEHEGERFIVIETYHQIELAPRSARALAKRLNAMADWMDGGKGLFP